MDIDAVQERTGDTLAVAFDGALRTAALPLRVAKIATRKRITLRWMFPLKGRFTM